jgi:D-alanyl-lipoteichoic acid acyltransferase DltB (MBOAT superfamily)
LGTVFFAFQIYCDFSAYSDIAIGSAKLFGIRLMRNFSYPYFSQSVGEFWRRWHISLSTWFRDYVFIPLGGSRCSPARRSLNLIVTFLISGLWHGAAWRYVVWGGINGIATATPTKFLRRTASTYASSETPGGESLIPHPLTLLRILGTFSVICAAWVFFRAETIGDAWTVLHHAGRDLFSPSAYRTIYDAFDHDRFLRKTALLLLAFVIMEWVQRRQECPLTLTAWPLPLRWTAYTALIWTTLYLMPQSGGREFIYFEF